MKRIGNIYGNIYDIENIKTAIMKASLGKRHRKYVKKVLDNQNFYAEKIRDMLLKQEYIPSPYTIKRIYDGARKKERIIYKPQFYPDQIIHWALILQIKDIIMRGMYEYNCGSVPKRGTSYGQKYLRKILNKDTKGTKYCLKMDVKKFYPSVDKEILKSIFRQDIKDKQCLWLIDQIAESGDDGLPIGNYTSQWFANYFLQRLDHFIKEDLHAKYYIRYIDDLVILGSNKRKLHRMQQAIAAYLGTINLTMKGDWQVFRVDDRAIDFLGLRFFRDKTILRKSNALRIKRRMRKIKRKPRLNYLDSCAVVSYWGWVKRSDSYHFYGKYIKSITSVGQAKKKVSEYARQTNHLRACSGI